MGLGRELYSFDAKQKISSIDVENNQESNELLKGPAENCKQATNMVQCKGKSKEGKICQRYTDNKGGFCWQHGQKAK